MSMRHHLATFLAEKSELVVLDEAQFPGYDPVTQLQKNWNQARNYLEIVCTSPQTGEPNTKSITTTHGPHDEFTDFDTYDSGT